MDRWEYQVLCSDIPEEGIDQFALGDWLNREGAEGWEMVSTECIARVVPGLTVPRYQLLLTLKRCMP